MSQLNKWIPSIIVMVSIFVLSSMTGKIINEAGLGKESYHINGHFILFVMLCFTFYKATNNIVTSIILTVIYGVIDEFHQLFVPGRSCSLFDVFVDSFGAFLVGGYLWKFQHTLPKRLKTWLNS